MKIDMSPAAVTGRMIALDQLWELAVALKSSVIVDELVHISTGSATARKIDEDIEIKKNNEN